MKSILLLITCLAISPVFSQQTRSKPLQLKYALPPGWNATEFGGKAPWEDTGNNLCHCSGVLFTRTHKDGKMNVLVYPSTVSGLDSAKRNAVGKLKWVDVQKYDKTRNKHFSFERKHSNFIDWPSGEKSYEVIRYFAKVDDHFYIIYAWQENMGLLNSTSEKDLYEMVNAIEPD